MAFAIVFQFCKFIAQNWNSAAVYIETLIVVYFLLQATGFEQELVEGITKYVKQQENILC